MDALLSICENFTFGGEVPAPANPESPDRSPPRRSRSRSSCRERSRPSSPYRERSRSRSDPPSSPRSGSLARYPLGRLSEYLERADSAPDRLAQSPLRHFREFIRANADSDGEDASQQEASEQASQEASVEEALQEDLRPADAEASVATTDPYMVAAEVDTGYKRPRGGQSRGFHGVKRGLMLAGWEEREAHAEAARLDRLGKSKGKGKSSKGKSSKDKGKISKGKSSKDKGKSSKGKAKPSAAPCLAAGPPAGPPQGPLPWGPAGLPPAAHGLPAPGPPPGPPPACLGPLPGPPAGPPPAEAACFRGPLPGPPAGPPPQTDPNVKAQAPWQRPLPVPPPPASSFHAVGNSPGKVA